MVLQFEPYSSHVLLALVIFVSASTASGCGVDERSLSSSTAGAASEGGSGFGAGNSGFGSSAAGDLVQGSSAGGSVAGAAAGSGALGGAGGAAGAGGSGGSGSSGRAGRSGDGGLGAGGGGGGAPCGDLDQDRVDDCAETLIQNSRFDLDVRYWVAEVLTTQAWDPRNARSGTGSGSMLISNVAPVDSALGAFMAGGHQCLQVTAGASYEVAVRALIPGGQPAGEAALNVQVFGADDCAGSFLQAQTLASTTDVDTWSVLEGEISTPPSARSMWVRLAASKPFTQATLVALFDDVLVRQK